MELNWRNVLEKDVKRKIEYANKEYKKYVDTGSIIYLQQSGNKLFSAVENFFMLKYGRRAQSYNDIKNMIKDNKYDKDLLRDANQLHRFFYNGTLQMDLDDAKDYYISVNKRLMSRMRL